jgi:transcriptional regulator with XRE-family HTH domain
MTDFAEELRRLRTERGWSLAQLAQRVPCNGAYLGQLEHGERRPSAQLARRVDDALGAGGALLDAAAPPPTRFLTATVVVDQDDEFEALELSRRVAASDIGATTLAALEEAADRFAIAYQSASPPVLLHDVRRYVRYVGELIDKPATLDQRRRLLVVGAWLSLLAATIDIDLRQRSAANARLKTAASLAHETGQTEIGAWCLETQAWEAVTVLRDVRDERVGGVGRGHERASFRGLGVHGVAVMLVVSRFGVHGVAGRRAESSPQRPLLINRRWWGRGAGRR